MRQRYSGSFSLGRDTTAKEVLHCFALAYFAVTPANQRSIEGLIDALCEDSYAKYEKYMQYPVIDTAVKGNDRLTAISEYSTELNDWRKSIQQARKDLRAVFEEARERSKDPKKKRYIKTLTDKRNKAIQILSNKDSNLKKILNKIKTKRVSIQKGTSSRFREKLYKFTAYNYEKEQENVGAKSWIESAYWNAEAVGPLITSYDQYVYVHSTSYSARQIKEIPLSVMAEVAKVTLDIEELKPDMFNPADIYAIKRMSLPTLLREYSNMMTKHYTNTDNISHTPLLNIITDQIRDKLCIPISLKKSLTQNPPVKFIGTKFRPNKDHAPLIDNYTHVLSYFDGIKGTQLKTKGQQIQETLDKLIEIKKIDYKHSIETFSVDFELNYTSLEKKLGIELSNEYYKLVTASMTWNALPSNSEGKVIGAYTGGAGFTQISQILLKYPKTRKVFDEISEHRKTAFKAALVSYVGDNIKLPAILNLPQILNKKTDRIRIENSIEQHLKQHNENYKNASNKTALVKDVYALYLVALNSLLLYSRQDETEMQRITTVLREFEVKVNNKKIASLLPSTTLKSFGWIKKSDDTWKPKAKQTRSQRIMIQQYAKVAYQEDRASKLEALYFYTEGKGSLSNGSYTVSSDILNDFYKKQITMTIYGLITKKGSKIFLTAPDIEEEKQAGRKARSISDALGFRTTPYFIIGNASD